MISIVPMRSVVLSSLKPSYRSPRCSISPLTATINIRLRHGIAWLESHMIRAHLIVRLDGAEYRATSGMRGGQAVPYSMLRYTLPHGFFGERGRATKRLGELGRVIYDWHIELELVEGVAPSLQVEAWTTEAPAPAWLYHSSVAFDAAASAELESGTGVLSWSHTASGSDGAVFLGAISYREMSNNNHLSQTYPGTGATLEMWDTAGAASADNAKGRTSGWYRVAPSTGVQTASFDTDFTDNTYKAGGTISMTGVHQTTPVGSSVTGDGLTSAETITVSDAASGDLVLDTLSAFTTSQTAPTIGADQTERNAQHIFFNPNAEYFRQSSQDGVDGGVMSWTVTDVHGTYGWTAGAVAFKPSSGAAAPGPALVQTVSNLRW